MVHFRSRLPDKRSIRRQDEARQYSTGASEAAASPLGTPRERQSTESALADIDSIIGESATFWFSIVCAEGVSTNVKHDLLPDLASQMAGDVAMTSLRILVAEDNEVNQKVLTAILTRAGHRVDIVGSGIEVVSAVIRR